MAEQSRGPGRSPSPFSVLSPLGRARLAGGDLTEQRACVRPSLLCGQTQEQAEVASLVWMGRNQVPPEVRKPTQPRGMPGPRLPSAEPGGGGGAQTGAG